MTSIGLDSLDRPTGVRRVIAVAAVLGAMAMAVLDAGMTNLALPDLARAFSVEPASAVLAVTAYQAGLIMALLPLGAIGERFGHRRVFAASVALFAVAASAAALAPSLDWLIAARLLQGLGGAGIMALGVALLRFTVARNRLGDAIGWNAMTVALASAAAPSLGVMLLAAAGWRGLYAIGAPTAALVLAASCALPSTPRRPGALDTRSMGLNALAFGLLILAGGALPRNAVQAAAMAAAALVALAILVRRESSKPAPLIPIDLLSAPSFRLSVIASVCCFTAQSAGLLGLPFLLQHRLHQGPLAAGLCITAWPLSVALAAVMAGRFSDRVSTARLCGMGGGALAAGLAGCAMLPLGVGPEGLIPFIALAGLGFGLFQSPNNRNLFLSAPAERSGAAGGMQGTARVSGQTLGALLMAGLFGRLGLEAALPAGFAIAAALALAAAFVSLRRPLT